MYVIVKVIFVAAGYLHPGAIIYGAIPAVLTIVPAVMSIVSGASLKRRIWNTLIIVLPVVFLLLTPLYM